MRICRLLVIVLLGLAAPVPAGDREVEAPGVPRLRLHLPAGRFAAFRYDADRGEFFPLHAPPALAPVPGAAKVLDRVPAWLRGDLERQLRRLWMVPIRAGGGPRDLEPRDADGDGLPDLVRVNEEGFLEFKRNRGMPGGPIRTLDFHREPKRFRTARFKGARPAVWSANVAVGDMDGGLWELHEDGGASVLTEKYRFFELLSTPRAFATPTFGDLDADGHMDLVLGGKEGGVRWYFGGGGGGLYDPELIDRSATGTFSVPCLADLDGDGDLDLLCGNREGKVLLFRNVGSSTEPRFERDTSDSGLEAIDVGDSSAPAAADLSGSGNGVDLVVGNQAGELRLFRGGGRVEDEHAFRDLDVGEFASPTFAIVPLDGSPRLCLIVGRLKGDLLLYEVRCAKGISFLEKESWSFEPQPGAKDLEEYYAKHYFPEWEEVLGPDDEKTLSAYLVLLHAAPERLLDEVAFTVAHTPAEVLRAMASLGEEGLLLDNAQAVHEMAERVGYASIVEKEDHTTLAYTGADGAVVEAPRDVYYWWVVHPRILYEIPARIDASWWDVSAEERGLTDSEWWKHEPERDIHEPTEKGVFWRQALVKDARFGKSLFDSVATAKDLGAALRAVHAFLANGSAGVGLMRFGYETQDVQPWQIYAKHYGSCGEHSILGAACARTMLIPASAVGCRGEDHAWNEAWDTDGRWHHFDCCGKDNVDRPWGSTEGREHAGKTVSTVTRWRGDDRLDATTATVFCPEESYTKTGSGYTDFCRLHVEVMDPDVRKVDGALVVVRSHWDNRSMVSIWGYTDGNGTVEFDLGYEPNGGYTVEAFTPLGSVGVTNCVVEENRDLYLVLKTPHERPEFDGKLFPALAPQGLRKAERSESAVRVTRSELRPPNLVTGQRYRISSYLTERHGYRGTRRQSIPVSCGELPWVYVLTSDEYRKFAAGEDWRAVWMERLRDLPSCKLPTLIRPDHVVVVSNLDSLFLDIDVEVASPARPVTDDHAPEIRLHNARDKLTCSAGGTCVIMGRATDDSGVAEVRLRWKGRGGEKVSTAVPDPETGEFRVAFDAGRGGPLPESTVAVRLEAEDGAGNVRTESLKVVVMAGRVFIDQVIRQDDPDDPLKDCSWIYGPFVLEEGERFFLAETKSTEQGFDMDMHLYFDKNGNGKVDGASERIARSTTPTANERIYLDFPKAGTYWLHCQGWKVEGESAKLYVEVYPRGRHRSIVDLEPVGRLREPPEAVSARFELPRKHDTVRVIVDGAENTIMDVKGFENVRLELPDDLEPNVPHEVTVRLLNGDHLVEEQSWSFVIDTLAPRLDVLAPEQGIAADQEIRIEARASDEGEWLTVLCRVPGRKERRLERDKERPGIYRLTLDAKGWTPGEHFVWLVARDEAGNETERVLRVVVPER